jgi:hypothetical protein
VYEINPKVEIKNIYLTSSNSEVGAFKILLVDVVIHPEFSSSEHDTKTVSQGSTRANVSSDSTGDLQLLDDFAEELLINRITFLPDLAEAINIESRGKLLVLTDLVNEVFRDVDEILESDFIPLL